MLNELRVENSSWSRYDESVLGETDADESIFNGMINNVSLHSFS